MSGQSAMWPPIGYWPTPTGVLQHSYESAVGAALCGRPAPFEEPAFRLRSGEAEGLP